MEVFRTTIFIYDLQFAAVLQKLTLEVVSKNLKEFSFRTEFIFINLVKYMCS